MAQCCQCFVGTAAPTVATVATAKTEIHSTLQPRSNGWYHSTPRALEAVDAYAQQIDSASANTTVSFVPHFTPGDRHYTSAPPTLESSLVVGERLSFFSDSSSYSTESLSTSQDYVSSSSHLSPESWTSSPPPPSPPQPTRAQPCDYANDPMSVRALVSNVSAPRLFDHVRVPEIEPAPQHSTDCPRANGKLTEAALSIHTDEPIAIGPQEFCDHPSCALRRLYSDDRCKAIEAFWTWSQTLQEWVHRDAETGTLMSCPRELD